MHNLVNELQLALADIKQVYLKQEHTKLEQVVDRTLSQIKSFEQQHYSVLNLVLNVQPIDLGTIDLLILRQVLISKKLATKLNYTLNSEVTMTKTSLFILYLLLPDIVSLLKQQISIDQFRTITRQTITNTFSLAFKLKVQDKDCLKLLSLLANKNKYSKTNLLAQTLVTLSINTNLLVNIKTGSERLNIEQALSSQFSVQPKWLIPAPYVHSVLLDLLTINSSDLFAGHLIRTLDRKYYLVFIQSEDVSRWLCVEYDVEAKQFDSRLTEIEQDQITSFFPQCKLSLQQAIDAISQTMEDWQAYTESTNSDISSPQEFYHSVPDFWPKIVKTLTSANIKHLSESIELEPKLKQILLQYASGINREKLTIRSSKHAISLVGQERVFPIVTSGLLTAVQHNHRFIGSEAINEKIRLLTGMSYLVAKSNSTRTLPEYVPMFIQLLTMSLFSVPKVKFSVASNNKPKLESLFPDSQHISLAEVYQYPNIKLWQKINKTIIKKWGLPQYVDIFISKYLISTIKPSQAKFSSNEQEWLGCIELSLACYLILENTNVSTDIQKRLMVTAKRYKMSLQSLEKLAVKYAQQLGYHSVLA